MTELRKWISEIDIYFDTRLVSSNALLESKLREAFESRGFNELLSLGEEKETRHLRVYVLSTETEIELERRVGDCLIHIESSNTNLFSSHSDLQHDALISTEADIPQALNLLEEVLENKIIKITNDIIEFSQDFFKKLVQKKKIQSYNFSKFSDKYDKILEEIVSCLEMRELESKIEKITQTYLSQPFSICHSLEAYLEDYTHLIPFQIKDDVYFLTWDKNETYSLEKSLVVYNALSQFAQRLEGNVLRLEYGNDYQSIINAIPFPIALFDEKGELSLHNAKFVNLNLTAKRCVNLNDNEQLTLKDELYKVYKIANEEATLFYFARVQDFIQDDTHSHSSSNDLGIITSSIAHELNNPLAGILAALDVILLDFESPEMASGINEMKETVNRCKKLVETFLGFSKYRPHSDTNYNDKIQDCFNQALELIRFRLIENNINVVTHIELDNYFNRQFNPHVMTMIFYLTLGELLTNFSHHKLVADDRSTSILLEFVETKDSFQIKKPEEFSLSSQFLQGKLIRHLIVTQSLKLKYNSDEITFYI